MCTWTTNTTFDVDPRLPVAALTEVEAIERWWPVPFRLFDHHARRLCAGDQLTVEWTLVGHRTRFHIDIERADATGLCLHPHGPFEIDVDYAIDSGFARVSARVETRGRGLVAKILMSATNALLSGGALGHALKRVLLEAGHLADSSCAWPRGKATSRAKVDNGSPRCDDRREVEWSAIPALASEV